MKELHKYSQFKSVQEMDKSVHQYLEEYDLNERDRTVLWKVSCYSVKFCGVSYLKVQTLAEITGYAKRTVQRALKHLTELGILTRIDQMRTVQRGQGASITVINPFECHSPQASLEEAAEPTEKPVEVSFSSCESVNSKTKTSLKDNTYVESSNKGVCEVNNPYGTSVNNELDTTHLVASGVPMEFAISTLPYFDAPKVYKLWSKVQLATRKHAPDLVDTVEIAISSIKASVLASKVKRVRDFTGYFYGVLAQKLSTAQRSLKCKLFNFLQ
ncbi:helix-turn-helix domain-containing protein [Bacillus nitratireducens]|uniref:helix-turn-helix domain-containing protein n=1 Tax=Bacillus nitratireducens TaxID=2026193 RepID=UPI001F5A0CD9|nr:helix-turn-helix domain-containing protein [Bacillus nitratireducens]UNP78646.1 helix-turn-helix domain-containing protein [Bacillus nitratireducens]